MSNRPHLSNKTKMYHKIKFRINFVFISSDLCYMLPPKNDKYF